MFTRIIIKVLYIPKMKYFIIVASKDHIENGVVKGFAQAGHGKKAPMERLQQNDRIVFNASKDKLQDGQPYQKFIALGEITDTQTFQIIVNEYFQPWRRKAKFVPCNEIEIRPLIEQLEFIPNKKHWGFPLRSGFLEIPKADFDLISEKMITQ